MTCVLSAMADFNSGLPGLAECFPQSQLASTSTKDTQLNISIELIDLD